MRQFSSVALCYIMKLHIMYLICHLLPDMYVMHIVDSNLTFFQSEIWFYKKSHCSALFPRNSCCVYVVMSVSVCLFMVDKSRVGSGGDNFYLLVPTFFKMFIFRDLKYTFYNESIKYILYKISIVFSFKI